MNRSTIFAVTMITLGSLVAACGGAPEDEYREALPSHEQLGLAVPGESAQEQPGQLTQALLGERAHLYTITRDVSSAVNGTIWVGLQIIEGIVAYPPSRIENGVAYWGPHTPPLETLTWTLAVTKKGPGQYAYVLGARAKDDNDGEFLPAIAGTSTKGAAGAFSGYYGVFAANATNLNKLDPVGHKDTGEAVATYDTRGTRRSVALAMKDYAEDSKHKSNALYRYVDRADTAGWFAFTVRSDIHEDDSEREVVGVRSVWDATGAGRGHAAVVGGDVPDGVVIAMSECWDSSFGRVFYQDNFDLQPREGDAEDCALPAPEEGAPDPVVGDAKE